MEAASASRQLGIDELLQYVHSVRASDLHIQVGKQPIVRHHGSLNEIPGTPVLTEESVAQLFKPLLDDRLEKEYRENMAVDFAYAIPDVARFRVNLFLQQAKMGAVFRLIPQEIPNLAKLGAPAALLDVLDRPRGLFLVTGPTGSGKSTTLAAMIDVINAKKSDHILTVEDPIEFVHSPKRCLINQREIGRDTPSFALGLKNALRQDPDVILVGEMRDLETISIAITAAETGHLVFGTLHTSSAPSTIDRVIDQFPEGQQMQIRVMLAESLIGVLAQTLLPRADGSGRVAAHEVLLVNDPVRNHIRQSKTAQIRTELVTKTREGMQTLDRSLVDLVARGLVAEDVARGRAQKTEEFDSLLAAFKRDGSIHAPRLVTPAMLGEQLEQETPTEEG